MSRSESAALSLAVWLIVYYVADGWVSIAAMVIAIGWGLVMLLRMAAEYRDPKLERHFRNLRG